MKVANQLYHPYKYKTTVEMCEERIIDTEPCTELNMHHFNLKKDFLLLSRTFLPVEVAYKQPTTMVSVDTVQCGFKAKFPISCEISSSK